MTSSTNRQATERTLNMMRLAGLHTFVLDGDVMRPCPGMCRAYGLPVDQPVNRDAFSDFIHEDDRERVRETGRRLRREGGSATLEFRARGVAGWRWMRTTVIAETQADGRVLIHGLEQDVTDLAEAREAALSAERQVRALMEDSRTAARRLKLALGVAQAGVFEIDHERGRFWCSPEFVLLVGQRMNFEQATALPWPFFHPEDRPAGRFRGLADRGHDAPLARPQGGAAGRLGALGPPLLRDPPRQGRPLSAASA